MSLLVSPIPYNAYSWTLGWIVITLFAYKSYKNYQRTKNPLAKIYAYIGIMFGTSFFFFGVPNALTNNPNTLLHTYWTADILAQLGMLAQARLLWFIGFRGRVRWVFVAIPTVCLSATILWFEIHGQPSHIVVDTGARLVRYIDAPITNYLKSLIYTIIAYPIGYFFIRQGFRSGTSKARATSIAAGLVFVFIASSSIQNALITKGSDNKVSVIVNTCVFITFQLVSSIWSWRQRLQTKQTQKSSPPQP